MAGGALGCLWLSRGLLVLGNVGHGSLLAGVAACARNLHGVSPKMLQEAWAPQAEETPKGQVKSTPIPDPGWIPFPGAMSCRKSLLEFASTPEVGLG